jgi:hypothetical protein
MNSAFPSLVVCLIITHFILIFFVYKLAKLIDRFLRSAQSNLTLIDENNRQLDLLFRCNTQLSQKIDDLSKTINDQLFFTSNHED